MGLRVAGSVSTFCRRVIRAHGSNVEKRECEGTQMKNRYPAIFTIVVDLCFIRFISLMMKMSGICHAPRCIGKLDGERIFRSPNQNTERFRVWEEFTGAPSKRKRIYLCSKHFEKKYFSICNGEVLRLLNGANAIPTIHCQGPDRDVHVVRADRESSEISSSTTASSDVFHTEASAPSSSNSECQHPDMDEFHTEASAPSSLNSECQHPEMDVSLAEQCSTGGMLVDARSETPCPGDLPPSSSTPFSPPSIHFPTPTSPSLSLSEPLAVPLPSTPKVTGSASRMRYLNRELLHMGRQKITPRKSKLIKMAKYLRSKFHRANRNLRNSRASISSLLNESSGQISVLENYAGRLSKAALTFINAQLRAGVQKARARRWSLEEKLLFLSILRRSPKAYSFLSALFTLPTPRTLSKFLNLIPLEPGINPHVFKSLSCSLKRFSKEKRICSLMFDEMSIREHLQYDPKADRFVGYEDLGLPRHPGNVVAKQALVFMVRGLTAPWKQPIAFYFTRDGIKTEVLVELLGEVLEACETGGLTVVSTVCDMASKNVKALRMMGATEKRPYFFFNERKIVALFDVPHLLKCTRNNLYRNIIHVPVTINGTRFLFPAEWNHIREAVAQDSKQLFYRHLGSLTERHLDPKGPDAMKVSLAAQVLSHKMASCISSCVASKVLPAAAIGTAIACGEINKLFDSLNGVGRLPQGAEGMRCAIFKDNEDLHLQFWSTTLQFLEGWRYYRCKILDGKCSTALFEPPSHRGWLQTIRGVTELWNILKSFNVSILQLRWLNQDALENLFGLIRYNCGSNRNPTSMQFTAALKTCLLNGLVDRDLQYGNCEVEESELLLNMREFLTPPIDNVIAPEHERAVSFARVQCKGYIYCIASVTATAARIILQDGNCSDCRAMLTTSSSCAPQFVRGQFKFLDDMLHPTDEFLKLVENVANVTETVLNESAGTGGIRSRVLDRCNSEINYEWVKNGCLEHYHSVFNSIVDTSCTLTIQWWGRKVNCRSSGGISKARWEQKLLILNSK